MNIGMWTTGCFRSRTFGVKTPIPLAPALTAARTSSGVSPTCSSQPSDHVQREKARKRGRIGQKRTTESIREQQHTYAVTAAFSYDRCWVWICFSAAFVRERYFLRNESKLTQQRAGKSPSAGPSGARPYSSYIRWSGEQLRTSTPKTTA